MKPAFERFIAVAALALAAVSISIQIANKSAAHAASSVVATTANDLGPADALLLNDAKPTKGREGKPLTVKAEGSRIGWSDQPTARAWSVAAVHVDKAMKAILGAPAYADKRQELEEETKKQDAEFGKRLEELQKKYAGLEPNSPEMPKAQQEAMALRDEYGRWREGSMRISEKLASEQIEKAYRELVAAVDIVSDREYIDIVYRFLPTAEAFNANTLIEAREQVFGRTLLRYPEAIDITAEVMKELGVKD